LWSQEKNMTNVERPVLRTEHAKHVCNICGKPSEDTICEVCSIKLRAEALVRKQHEDKGEE
jgi:recombinational DNA repair protein RecR